MWSAAFECGTLGLDSSCSHSVRWRRGGARAAECRLVVGAGCLVARVQDPVFVSFNEFYTNMAACEVCLLVDYVHNTVRSEDVCFQHSGGVHIEVRYSIAILELHVLASSCAVGSLVDVARVERSAIHVVVIKNAREVSCERASDSLESLVVRREPRSVVAVRIHARGDQGASEGGQTSYSRGLLDTDWKR